MDAPSVDRAYCHHADQKYGYAEYEPSEVAISPPDPNSADRGCDHDDELNCDEDIR